jgi:hypothetical protein
MVVVRNHAHRRLLKNKKFVIISTWMASEAGYQFASEVEMDNGSAQKDRNISVLIQKAFEPLQAATRIR